jgi:hypothetical protein
LITFVLLPKHLPLPLDQTCFITWSHVFTYPSTSHSLFINLALLPDHTNVIRWSNKFDQEVMRGARVITQMWSGNKFYHLITCVYLPEHLSFPLYQSCFITWSHLFYYTGTFHYHLITFVLSPEHLPLPLHQSCFITWSSLFYYLITSRDNGRCSSDKTNVIRW